MIIFEQMVSFNTREDTKYIVTCKARWFCGYQEKGMGRPQQSHTTNTCPYHNPSLINSRARLVQYIQKLHKLLLSCWDSILKSLYFSNAIALSHHTIEDQWDVLRFIFIALSLGRLHRTHISPVFMSACQWIFGNRRNEVIYNIIQVSR